VEVDKLQSPDTILELTGTTKKEDRGYLLLQHPRRPRSGINLLEGQKDFQMWVRLYLGFLYHDYSSHWQTWRYRAEALFSLGCLLLPFATIRSK
jgi:hypothetical protein